MLQVGLDKLESAGLEIGVTTWLLVTLVDNTGFVAIVLKGTADGFLTEIRGLRTKFSTPGESVVSSLCCLEGVCSISGSWTGVEESGLEVETGSSS